MALPTVAKTWAFQVNQTIAATGTALGCGQALAFAIKQSLIGAGSWTDIEGAGGPAPSGAWVVDASSDGTTAGHDGVDRWAAPANIIPNGGTIAWMVLRNDVLGMSFLFRFTASFDLGFVRCSRVGFGAAHGGVDGNTTTNPTAVDFIDAIQSSYWGAPSTNLATALSVQIATDGSTIVSMFRNGLVGFWTFQALGSPAAGWLYPILASGGADGATGDLASFSAISQMNLCAWKNDGTAMSVGLGTLFQGAGGLLSNMTSANPFSGAWPILPVIVVQTSGGNNLGVVGHLQDLFYALDGAGSPDTGDAYDEIAVTARRFLHADYFTFPWNNTLPTINPNGSEPARVIRFGEFTQTITEPVPAATPPSPFLAVSALGTSAPVGIDVYWLDEPLPHMPGIDGRKALLHRLYRRLSTQRGRFPWWPNDGVDVRDFLLSKQTPAYIERIIRDEVEKDDQVNSAEVVATLTRSDVVIDIKLDDDVGLGEFTIVANAVRALIVGNADAG